MRNQFFTQPICFCYVVSSEERKAGKLFFAIPKYIPSCSFTRGRSSKARPWPKSRNFANASSKALLCQYYKYVGYCVSSRQQFYFFMRFLFRIQQLKKTASFVHIVHIFFFFCKVVSRRLLCLCNAYNRRLLIQILENAISIIIFI